MFTELSLCHIRHLYESIFLFVEHDFHSQYVAIHTYKQRNGKNRVSYSRSVYYNTHPHQTSLNAIKTSVHNQDAPLYHTIKCFIVVQKLVEL